MSQPEPDGLQVEPFAVRLERFLRDAMMASGARALALVEVDARDRVLGPRVRVALPEGVVSSEIVTRLGDELIELGEEGVIAPGHAALRALGPTFVELGATVRRLAVRPRLWSESDAWLCLAGGAPCPVATLDALTRGLSDDRAERLARAVFQAVETATDPMEITDGTVRAFYVNRAWERFTGYSRDEVVGRTLTFLRDPDAPKHDPAFFRFCEGLDVVSKGWISTIGSRRKDGSPVLAEVAVGVFDAAAEGLQGNLGVRRDMKARAAREGALAAVHLELHRIIEALPQATAVLRDGRIYFANGPLFSLFQRKSKDVLGAPLASFVHEEDRASLDVADTGEVRRLRIARPDAIRFVELASAGTISFEGRPSQIVLFRDLTDERLSSARAAHADRLAALGSLAASVAHEINNPLALVVSNLESLGAREIDEERRCAQRDALEGARRIGEIIGEMRQFVRLDKAATPALVDVARAVGTARKLVANELRHLADVTLDHEPGLTARAQEVPLVQVLVNLLLNAARAMTRLPGRPHKLEVRSRGRGEQVEISVRDSGAPLDEAELARLFEPFAGDDGAEGSGLGLSVSRRIVEGFQGTIRAESDAVSGTTITVSLPRAEARPVEVEPQPAEPRRARILIIDDEPGVGRALKRLLGEHDVEVLDGSADALNRLRAAPSPDVIFCDLMMPGVTGYALYTAVLAEVPELAASFVFLTGGAFTEEADKFLEEMGARVLLKPFRTDEVRRAVATTLARLGGGLQR